jgi:electron transfer flavoprotein alpha subunit
MGGIWVLVEHIRGDLRDITFEMLSKAHSLAGQGNAPVTAVVLGRDPEPLIALLRDKADEILAFRDPVLEPFTSDRHLFLLAALIREKNPRLFLLGHTAQGMDLAPALAVEVGLPLATDVVDFYFEQERLMAWKEWYGGKIRAQLTTRKGPACILTVRSGAFPYEENRMEVSSRVFYEDLKGMGEGPFKEFLSFVEAPASGVDITKADVVVSVGRGIGDRENLPLVEELAEMIGGVLSCSRPVADNKWLPKDRQVGTSGKTVRPKVYLAVGISGAFQHLAGMKNAGTIIAINKDPRAPIFKTAHYGIVGDLLKVVPVLKERIRKQRQ